LDTQDENEEAGSPTTEAAKVQQSGYCIHTTTRAQRERIPSARPCLTLMCVTGIVNNIPSDGT